MKMHIKHCHEGGNSITTTALLQLSRRFIVYTTIVLILLYICVPKKILLLKNYLVLIFLLHLGPIRIIEDPDSRSSDNRRPTVA
jgi:hypothetical protein